MSETKCPDCGGSVNEFQYSNLALVEVATGMKCSGCNRFWETVSEFMEYCGVCTSTPAPPDKICKVCGNDVHHVTDSPWRQLDHSGGPAVCPTCCMCPTCGASMFEATEHGRVRCIVCDAHWTSVAEFEGELLARADVLGLKVHE